MEKKIIRIIIIIFAVLIQTSFLAVVFPQYQTPGAILALVISWTIISGFQQMFPWIIFLGFFMDIVSFQTVGVNIILLMMISYFVSFFSRRISVEHKGWGILMAAVFIIFSTSLYYLADIFIINLRNITGAILGEILSMSGKNLVTQAVFNLALFFLIYFPLKKIENFLSFYGSKIKI